MTTFDQLRRPMRNLRLSVTDRCNLRCQYCMPEENYTWLPRSEVLRFEEISRLVDVFATLGVDRVRLTGGEPLLRAELPRLIRMIADKPAIVDLALTTNGVLLAERVKELRAAGLQRLNISLDTTDPSTFRMLARRDDFTRVVNGIDAARAAGFENIKIDTVVIAGVNDHELATLVEFANDHGAEVRFIEYMDVGGATKWNANRVVSRARMLEHLGAHFGTITPEPRTCSAPAERFTLKDGTVFGIISSMTQPFCGTCDRARLTADGMWFTCLYALRGHDLGAILRNGASDNHLAARIRELWTNRRDRGAEERTEKSERNPLALADHLRTNPHLEMHTRGG